MDSVDLEAAKKAGVDVMGTPDAPTEAVAELALGLMLDALRKVSAMDRGVRKGVWKKEMGFLLEGKTVGIVGLGRIGRRVAQLHLSHKYNRGRNCHRSLSSALRHPVHFLWCPALSLKNSNPRLRRNFRTLRCPQASRMFCHSFARRGRHSFSKRRKGGAPAAARPRYREGFSDRHKPCRLMPPPRILPSCHAAGTLQARLLCPLYCSEKCPLASGLRCRQLFAHQGG